MKGTFGLLAVAITEGVGLGGFPGIKDPEAAFEKGPLLHITLQEHRRIRTRSVEEAAQLYKQPTLLITNPVCSEGKNSIPDKDLIFFFF